MSVSNEFFYNNTTLAGEAIFFDPVKIGCGAGSVNQGENSVALGTGAGYSNQGARAVAIGYGAGGTAQGVNSISIGAFAGQTDQHSNSIILNATGTELNNITQAGLFIKPVRLDPDNISYVINYNVDTNELTYGLPVSLGKAIANYNTEVRIVDPNGPITMKVNNFYAGTITEDKLAVGKHAGETSQGQSAVAFGANSGAISQGEFSVAVGPDAGKNTQGVAAVAVGYGAGQDAQATRGVAIGDFAGSDTQGSDAIAIGTSAGELTQNLNAIAIGSDAGYDNQGTLAIAIGNQAGKTNQAARTIILNASGVEVNGVTNQTDSLYIAPIRSTATNSTSLVYNSTTKEVTTGFPCLPTYASDAAANAAITAASLVLTEGMMYVDTTLHKVKVYLNNVWVTLSP